MILELLLDALLDSVKMLPFLFAAYWLIEYVEHRHSEGIEKALAGGGRFGFVPGAGTLQNPVKSTAALNKYKASAPEKYSVDSKYEITLNLLHD